MRARLALTLAPILTGLLLAGTAPAAARQPGPARFFPDPSSVFSADIAFNRLAAEKGLWAAYRATAAEDAVLLVPKAESAKSWLKGRKDDPALAMSWQAYRAFVSCDGRMAATTGTWRRRDGAQGEFVTLWRRDRKGDWKWAFDSRLPGEALPEPPEALEGRVARCKGAPAGAPPLAGPGRDGPPPGPPPSGKDAAIPDDGSLMLSYAVQEDGSREVRLSVWNGAGYDVAVDQRGMAAQ